MANYVRHNTFHANDVPDYVTEGARTFSYIIMSILLRAFLWCEIQEPNGIHHLMAPLTSFIENFCLKVYLKNWLRYRYSKFQFCLLPSAIDILATVTTLGTFKHLDISNVSCKFQRNRPSSFWDTARFSLSSAQRGLLTHLCFRGTNIVLTAKRSYSRTFRRLQTILCDFWNLLQVLLRPKNA